MESLTYYPNIFTSLCTSGTTRSVGPALWSSFSQRSLYIGQIWVIIRLGYHFKLSAFLAIAIKWEGFERFLERPQIFSRPCFFLCWKIVPVPSGLRDVSSYVVLFVGKKKKAMKYGLSTVHCKVRMSSVVSKMEFVAWTCKSFWSRGWSLALGDRVSCLVSASPS